VKAIANGIKLTIACGGAATQSCNGKVVATTTEHLIGSTVTAITASAKHHKRVVVVARRSYGLAGGQHVTLTLKLNAKGKKLLKRFGKLPVIVKITERNAAGKQVTITRRKLTIKPRHRKHG
jgi:hypothetical protein